MTTTTIDLARAFASSDFVIDDDEHTEDDDDDDEGEGEGKRAREHARWEEILREQGDLEPRRARASADGEWHESAAKDEDDEVMKHSKDLNSAFKAAREAIGEEMVEALTMLRNAERALREVDERQRARREKADEELMCIKDNVETLQRKISEGFMEI